MAPIKKKDRSPLQQPEVLSKYPFEDLTIDLLGSELPKSLLPVMSDNDVLVFFLTFERICQINNIDKSIWARLLTPQLTGQGMKVFLRISSDDAKDYDAAKRAILAYYKLNAQQYLKMFRSMKRTGQIGRASCRERV